MVSQVPRRGSGPIPEGSRRIVVVGSTGWGKTAFAGELSRRLGIPHVELDALNWGPNWTEVPDERFRESTAEQVAQDSWVVDGNYHRVRDIVWPRASTVVWLDYPFSLVSRQLVVRTFRRAFARTTLWSGNRERLWTHFLTRDSLFLWLFKTYWRRKREYPRLFGLPEYAHLTVVRSSSSKQSKRWLDRVAPETGSKGNRDG